MKNTILAILAVILLTGCGGADTAKPGENKKPYDPYNPVQNFDPSKSQEIVENRNVIPGDGAQVYESTTKIEVLALAGSPVLITDNYFTVLFGASNTEGAKKIIEILKARKIAQLDRVIIPSTNPETFSGLQEMIGKVEIMTIDSLQSSDSKELNEIKKLAFDKMIVTKPSLAGSKWISNGVLFEILYPMTADLMTGDPSDQTCVLRIEKDGISAILTGDITEAAEKKMVERGKIKPSTYVIATNGAPVGSFSPEFLDAAKPKEIVIGMRTVDSRGFSVKTQAVGKENPIVITLGNPIN